MAYTRSKTYPDHLNPFGDDDEQDELQIKNKIRHRNITADDYPDHLSPFADEDYPAMLPGTADPDSDYDNSLNPFDEGTGDEDLQDNPELFKQQNYEPALNSFKNGVVHQQVKNQSPPNPFDEDEDEQEKEEQHLEQSSVDNLTQIDDPVVVDPDRVQLKLELTSEKTEQSETTNSQPPPMPPAPSPTLPSLIPLNQPDSLECPPKPLPRTKSLLKKELAQKSKLQQQMNNPDTNSQRSLNSIPSTSSNSQPAIPGSNCNTLSPCSEVTDVVSFQKKKNKRNAPPVPINYKRQVSGSLQEIEKELNTIGDNLAIIEKESMKCHERLSPGQDEMSAAEFVKSRSEFIDLFKRKKSIVRRQKELMYKKRELQLDQTHSDIEYELRMIGNKQLSIRTLEDEAREKELLKQLVDIVEEKNDIVENLNKESPSDSQEIVEALKRHKL